MHTFCIAVAGDALGASDDRFEPASTHVYAHDIRRTLTFDVRTHSSYVQSAIFQKM